MVEFVLRNVNSDSMLYEYYPEGKKSKISGFISVMLKEKDIVLNVVAEDDFKCSTKEELKELKDAIDEMYQSIGAIEPIDDDWDVKVSDYEWYYYADKVMDSLRLDLLQGKIRKRGIVV